MDRAFVTKRKCRNNGARWLLSNQNNRCLFAGDKSMIRKMVESDVGLFVTGEEAAISGSNLI